MWRLWVFCDGVAEFELGTVFDFRRTRRCLCASHCIAASRGVGLVEISWRAELVDPCPVECVWTVIRSVVVIDREVLVHHMLPLSDGPLPRSGLCSTELGIDVMIHSRRACHCVRTLVD